MYFIFCLSTIQISRGRRGRLPIDSYTAPRRVVRSWDVYWQLASVSQHRNKLQQQVQMNRSMRGGVGENARACGLHAACMLPAVLLICSTRPDSMRCRNDLEGCGAAKVITSLRRPTSACHRCCHTRCRLLHHACSCLPHEAHISGFQENTDIASTTLTTQQLEHHHWAGYFCR